jgi:hypothetical protein
VAVALDDGQALVLDQTREGVRVVEADDAGAEDELVERLLRRQGEQLLLRAVLFRVAVDGREAEAYQRLIALLRAC